MTDNDVSQAARLLDKQKRRFDLVCIECGAAMVGLRNRRWCGNTCAVRNWRRRKKAERLLPPEPPIGAAGEAGEKEGAGR